MINLIIAGLFIFGFFMGLKRGFILQTFHLLGFIASFVVAAMYYDKLAPYLDLWIPYPEVSDTSSLATFLQTLPLETGFYNAISFALIFFITKIVLQIIASMLDFVASIPIISWFNSIFGAVLGFVEVYLILFIVLFIIILVPFPTTQDWINDSSVALFIIENTPYLSKKVESLWFSVVESLLP